MKTALALLIFSAVLIPNASAKNKDWQTGRVMDFSADSEQTATVRVPFGGAVVTGPLYVTRVDIAIMSSSSVYHCFELRRGRQRLPVLAHNAQIEFRAQKGDLVFVDQVGCKHKARILSIE